VKEQLLRIRLLPSDRQLFPDWQFSGLPFPGLACVAAVFNQLFRFAAFIFIERTAIVKFTFYISRQTSGDVLHCTVVLCPSFLYWIVL
jgi:hypothetical protein